MIDQTVETVQAPHASGGRGLRRTLGAVASVAIAFSAAGVSAGIYSLFGFSLASSGPAFFWGWILVGLGTGLLCLVWAELASHYPLAGVMYQWPRKLGTRTGAWWAGWMYLFAFMYTLCSIYLILPAIVLPLLGFASTTASRVEVAVIGLVIAAVVNVMPIHSIGKLTTIATVAELVLIFGITLATLIAGAHQNVSVLVNTNGTGATFGAWLPGFLAGGVFIGLWVMESFEVGGTVGEETIDAPRRAPRAILTGWGASFVVGLFMLFAFLIAIPHLGAITNSSTPVLDIVNGALATWVGKLYLALLLLVTVVGANVVFTMVSRQIYGMSRVGLMPFANQLCRISRTTGEPWVAILVTAVITGLPLIISNQLTVLVTGSTAVVYLVYFAVSAIALVARLRGWPREERPFRLGRWGLPVNALAVLYTGAACLNLLWFRSTTNPNWHGLPVAIWLIVLPVVVGTIFWAVKGRSLSDGSSTVDLDVGAV